MTRTSGRRARAASTDGPRPSSSGLTCCAPCSSMAPPRRCPDVHFELTGPSLVLGLITGMTYGILAVGLVLVYRSNRIINFAHGQIGAFGAAAFGLLVATYNLPYWLMLPVALAFSAGVRIVVVAAARPLPRNVPPAFVVI